MKYEITSLKITILNSYSKECQSGWGSACYMSAFKLNILKMADGHSSGDGTSYSKMLLDRISEIRADRNPERRLKMLQELNESLPSGMKVEMPSLVTNAYVRKALDTIEERLNSSSAND